MHNSNVSFCIYMHTNIITGKQYIGLTSKGIEKRWKSHIAFAKKHNKYYFHRAINKYGIDSWKHEILEDNIKNIEDANMLEKFYINKYDTFNNGYNSTIGGDGTTGNRSVTEKTIRYKESRKTMVKFIHKDYGMEELCIDDMSKKYNISKSNLCSVSKGNRKNVSGWYLYNQESLSDIENKKEDYFSSKLITVYNEITLATVTGNSKEVSKLTGLKYSNLKRIYEGEISSTLGYRLLDESKIKVVSQYDCNDKIVAIYNSPKTATNIISAKSSSGIVSCLNNSQEYCYGFKWKYEYINSYEIFKMFNGKGFVSFGNNIPDKDMSQKKKIIQFSLSGEFIKEYDSIIEAERSNLITGIMHVLNGKHFHAGGYIWKYSEPADIREKNARAELQEEKAREIRAKTDLLDQQFLDKKTGKDRKQKIQDEIIRDNAKKAAMEHKAIVDIQKKNIMDGNNSLNQENFQ